MGNKSMSQEDRIKHYADLIQKQTGRAVRPYRADGYVNMMTRYGTSKDSSEQYKFVPEGTVPDELLTMYYEGNGLFAKIIDTPAEEAIKHGFTLDDVSDQKVEDFYTEALDELDWEETAMTAIKWARLFGGSIAVMLINDGRGLEEPLDWRNIQSIDDIRVYDRSLIQPDYSSMFSYDPQDPFRTRGSRLGMPEYYQVFSKYGNFVVHDSRCLVFQNGVLPENATNSVYQLWGVPEYIRINKAIRDAEVAHRSAPKFMERSVQPVYKMKDLAAELSTEEGEDRVLRRLQIIDMARGLLNSLVIDSEGEDYDFKTFQFAGINDVVSASCNMLSAITNIPQTILFGQSVGGLSTTDDTSMENYYNYIERIQKRMLKSNLRYLLSIIFQAGVATGEVDEVPKIKVKFNPLWSLSDNEQADLDLKRAQIQQTKATTAQIYVGMEAIDPSEVRKKLADSEEFDVENMLDEYDDEDLFAGIEEQMGCTVPDGTGVPVLEQGQNPTAEGVGGRYAPEGQNTGIVEQGSFADYAQGISVEEHNADPEDGGGNGPAAAPAATKLPQDMSGEEKRAKNRQNADGISTQIEEDGGPGSGNHNHEGRPGEVGGSLPSGSTFNDRMKEAFNYKASGKSYSEVGKEMRKCLHDMPVGSKLTVKGTEYEKTGEGTFKYKLNGKDATTVENYIANMVSPFDESTMPKFDDPKAKEVAEAKVESGDLAPEETSVPVSKYSESKAQTTEMKSRITTSIKDATLNEDVDGVVDALADVPAGAKLLVGGAGETLTLLKTEDGSYYCVDKFWDMSKDTMTPEAVAEHLVGSLEDPETMIAEISNISATGHTPQNSNPDADGSTGEGLFEKKMSGSKVQSYQELSDDEKKVFIAAAREDTVVDPDYLNAISDAQRLSVALNNNGKPEVISKEEFEAARDSGKQVMYRGVSGQVAVDSLMHGDETYLGDGLKGDGIYMSDDRSHILGDGSFGGKKMGLFFKDSATVKSEKEIYEEMESDPVARLLALDHALNASDYCLLKGYDGYWFYNGADQEGVERYYCMVKRDNLCVCQLEDDAT